MPANILLFKHKYILQDDSNTFNYKNSIIATHNKILPFHKHYN